MSFRLVNPPRLPTTYYIGLGFFAAANSWAADINWQANLTSGAQYNDNPAQYVAKAPPSSGLAYGGTAVVYRREEARDTRFTLNIDEQNYAQERDYQYHTYAATLAHQEIFQRYSLGATAEYLNETTEAAAQRSGEVSAVNYQQTIYTLRENALLQINEYWTADASALQSKTDYRQLIGGSDTQTLKSGFNYAYSERTTASISVSRNIYQPADSVLSQATTDGLTLGANFLLTQTLSVQASAGYRNTLSEYHIFDLRVDAENASRYLALSLAQKRERYSWNLTYSQDLVPRVNAVIDDTQRLELSADYQWTEKLSSSQSLGYIDRTPINGSGYIDNAATNYQFFSHGINWALTERLALTASYQYRHQEIPVRRITSVSNAVNLGVRWQIHP